MIFCRTKYPLREYQKDWIEQIFASWQRGHQSVLAQLPTGAGKTVCFAHISDEFLRQGGSVLVIAHRTELIEQAVAKLESVTGWEVGIIKYGVEPYPERRVQVASIQTLARKELLPDLKTKLLIFDEAHHATSSSYRKIIQFYPEACILGVTATPVRIDGQSLKDIFNDLIIGVSPSKLIQKGYLSGFRLFATERTINTTGVTAKRDYISTELALAINSQISASDIYQIWNKYAHNRKTIVFAASVGHSKTLAQEYQLQGISAEHLDGDTAPAQRFAILKEFEQGNIQVLCNYQILTEGYDCSSIEAVLCVRPTKSLVLWHQMIGRGLRPNLNQDHTILIDLTENWQQHGLPDEPVEWKLTCQPASKSLGNRGLVKCCHCTHVFVPLSNELISQSASVDELGKLVFHYQARCPNCGQIVEFDKQESSHYVPKVPLKKEVHPEIKELDLSVNKDRIHSVIQLIDQKHLNGKPNKIYTAIFMEFIETIQEFTLGEWREIVIISQAPEEIPTKKAWELFQEAYRRYKNRLAALSYVEERKKKALQDSEAKVSPALLGRSQQLASLERAFESQGTKALKKELQPSTANHLALPKVGKPELRNQYRLQWSKTLKSVKKHSPEAVEFLSNSSGLFNVEENRLTITVTVEVLEEGLKLFRSQIKQPVLNECFSIGFGKPVKVMFRLPVALMNSRH
jgi:superfamily II DNA or RNA helicase